MDDPDFTAYESIVDCPIKMPMFGLRIFVGFDEDGDLFVGHQLDGTGPAYTIVGAIECVKLGLYHDLQHEDDDA